MNNNSGMNVTPTHQNIPQSEEMDNRVKLLPGEMVTSANGGIWGDRFSIIYWIKKKKKLVRIVSFPLRNRAVHVHKSQLSRFAERSNWSFRGEWILSMNDHQLNSDWCCRSLTHGMTAKCWTVQVTAANYSIKHDSVGFYDRPLE